MTPSTPTIRCWLSRNGAAIIDEPESENNLFSEAQPTKMYYLNNPVFRYERPQAGRLVDVPGTVGISALDGGADFRAAEARYGAAWYAAICADIWGR